MREGREAILQALARYGASPLSFLVRYEAPWRTFSLPGGEGLVCYLEARGAAVVWTDPMCPPAELPGLLTAFAEAMRAERRGVCIVAASEGTARTAIAGGFSALKIGEEPWFDLASWHPPRGDRGKKLRWAVNHARRLEVEVGEYRPAEGRDQAVEAEVQDVVARWRAALRRPEPQSFMRADPLAEADEKRIFLARHAGLPVAMLACSRLPAANGWYLEDLARAPEAPNGATELLIVEALASLRADGAAAAAFALAPMRGVNHQLDRRARWLGRVLSIAIRGFDRRYGFRAIARYEERFDPTEWRASYICFLPALPRPAVVRATVRYLSA